MVRKYSKTDGKTKATSYAFVVFMYIFVFQQLLQDISSVFQYADELFSGLAIVAFILDIANKRKIGRGNKYMILCMGIVVTCGLWSSWAYQYQSAKAVFSDLLVVIKFFMSVYVGERMFGKVVEDAYARNFIRRHAIFVVCMFAFLTVLDYVFDLFPWDERYGMRAIRLFYDHQTFLVAAGVFVLCTYAICAQKRMTIVVLLPLCAVMALTLRAKAFGIIAAALAMYILSTKLNKRLNIIYIVLLAAGLYMLVGEQIEFYYGNTDDVAARTVLNQTSFRIAKDFFPFGTGFGSFASHQSAVEYSPIYSLYKISNVWGISKDMPLFISDTFWPMILGQFGVLGLCAYVIALAILFFRVQRVAKGNRYLYYGAITAFIYLMISSTAESAFANSIAVPLGWVIGIALSDKSYLNAKKAPSLLKRLKTRNFHG